LNNMLLLFGSIFGILFSIYYMLSE
jgi:hypothetical protein